MQRTPFDDIMDLRDRLAAVPCHSGKVHWFNATTGDGVVKLDDGTSLYCHYTAIHGVDKNGYAYPTESDQAALRGIGGARCMVLPYISPGYIGCERVVILDWLDAV